MGMRPILPITVPVKKIKGATRQCYGDGDGVTWCEQALMVLFTCNVQNIKYATHKNGDVNVTCKRTFIILQVTFKIDVENVSIK